MRIRCSLPADDEASCFPCYFRPKKFWGRRATVRMQPLWLRPGQEPLRHQSEAQQLNGTIQGFELFSQQAMGQKGPKALRRGQALWTIYIKGQKSEKAYNSQNSIILDDSNKYDSTANNFAIYTATQEDEIWIAWRQTLIGITWWNSKPLKT